MFFFFFFQAEDGIRDLIVTGVQTCALPISTLAQPLQVIAFSGAKPPAWAKPHADRPSHDIFTFQALADGHVRLALVGVREADDAVIVATKQAATAPRLFRRYAPNVLLWTVPSDPA